MAESTAASRVARHAAWLAGVTLTVLLVAAGLAMRTRRLWARSVGIAFASLSMIASFLFIPYYPVWSLLIIALDFFIIWALTKVGWFTNYSISGVITPPSIELFGYRLVSPQARYLLALVIVTWVVVFRTPSGLRLRSAGENPLAAETAGLSVVKTRYLAVITSGVLAGAGGAYLSIGFVHSFSQNMTIGKGFIALAALIFGRWRPGGALMAALLFGFSTALAQRLPVFSPSAATLFQALPYVLTLVAVAGLVGRSIPPAAIGRPLERS